MSPETIFDQALDRYERPLVSYARTITGDLESARDDL
jgi:DNA-directed RNA polymerase specialized sigma24 family protein